MYDGFVGLYFNRHLAERYFTVTPVKFAHDAFGSLCITGYNRHGSGVINVVKGLVNTFINGQVFRIIKTAKIDQE